VRLPTSRTGFSRFVVPVCPPREARVEVGSRASGLETPWFRSRSMCSGCGTHTLADIGYKPPGSEPISAIERIAGKGALDKRAQRRKAGGWPSLSDRGESSWRATVWYWISRWTREAFSLMARGNSPRCRPPGRCPTKAHLGLRDVYPSDRSLPFARFRMLPAERSCSAVTAERRWTPSPSHSPQARSRPRVGQPWPER